MTTGKYTRADQYVDNGCGGLCVKSLECPYPVCIHDDPGVVGREKRPRTKRPSKRPNSIDYKMALCISEGRRVADLVRIFGKTRWFINAALRRVEEAK